VKLYGTGAVTTQALASWIIRTISQGSGVGVGGGCTGFRPLHSGARVYAGTLARFAHTTTSYPTGLGNWAPTGRVPQTRVFQFSYTLNAATPNPWCRRADQRRLLSLLRLVRARVGAEVGA
jgi:hypothetical protein